MHYVGWDWATETHDVTVLDEAGTVVDRFAVTHDEEGLQHGLERLGAIGRPGELPVAIETTNGLAVERLLAAGHPVVPVHPNAFNAARPRWGASRAKSDPGDSLKLADYLRTDGHRLRRLEPPDDRTKELQALVRMRDDHVAARVAATNQLGDLLDRHWPGARRIFASLDSEIALAFLVDYPRRVRRPGWAKLASLPFVGAITTRVADPPRSSSSASGGRHILGLRSTQWCSPSWWVLRWPSSARSEPPSPGSTEPSATPSSAIPRHRSWPLCPGRARSAWPRSSPRSVRSSSTPRRPRRPMPSLGPPRSPGSRGKAPPRCTSAGP